MIVHVDVNKSSKFYFKSLFCIILKSFFLSEQVENGRLIQDAKMDIFQAIQFVVVVKSWEEITAESIRNCWNHPKILPNTNRMEVDLTDDPTVDDLSDQ